MLSFEIVKWRQRENYVMFFQENYAALVLTKLSSLAINWS